MSGAQGYFRLAEPTSPQIRRSISLPAARSSATDSIAVKLVVGFIIGEASRKFGIETSGGVITGAPRICRSAAIWNQMPGNLKQAFLELGLAHLPCAAAKLVRETASELSNRSATEARYFRPAETAEVIAHSDFKTVVGSASGDDSLEANEATDTVIDMDDDIASV